MGLSSKKVKSTTKPIYGSQLEGAAGSLKNAYNQQAPKVAGIADSLTGLLPGMIDKYKAGNPAVNAANRYVTTTLRGDGTNPHLDQYIAQTSDDVSNRLGARLNKMGLSPAGTTDQGLQARELAKVGLGMRYDDWNAGQQRKANAAGMAPGLAAADVIQVAPMLSTAQLGANLPMDLATRYAAGTGGLLGQYTNTTQKSKGSLLDSLGQVAQIGAIAFSDERLKDDIKEVGKTKAGLPIYTYRYKGDDKLQMGVMAQEVEKRQPAALGQRINGFRTVDYSEVR